MQILNKIITKLYRWTTQRTLKRQVTHQKSAQDKKRAEIYESLRKLYNYIEFINKKVLVNRRARKNFWRRVASNEPILEETTLNIMKAYAPKVEEAKKPEPPKGRLVNTDGRVKPGEEVKTEEEWAKEKEGKK